MQADLIDIIDPAILGIQGSPMAIDKCFNPSMKNCLRSVGVIHSQPACESGLNAFIPEKGNQENRLPIDVTLKVPRRFECTANSGT